MPRAALRDQVDQRLSAGARASDRFSDLQLEFVDEDNGDVLGVVGGRWDRLRKEYVGDAETSRIIRVHSGQVAIVRFFFEWLAAHLYGGDPVLEAIYDVLAHGGRRGGKTSVCVWLVVAYAVAVPRAICWIVLPSDVAEYGEEITDYLEGAMPLPWYVSLGAPHWRYTLINGSRIRLLSGFTPRKLKKGRADFALFNEAQQMVARSYSTVRAPISDFGGMCLSAANPPDAGDPGTWVGTMARDVKQGKRKAARTFHLDPEVNPHIDQASLQAMREVMSQHEYDVQIRGMFLLPSDVALNAWSPLDNEKPAPLLGDVTGVVTRHFEGEPFEAVVGIDLQHYPWVVGLVGHFFWNPAHPNDPEEALLWITHEVFVDRGDEVHLADGLKALGLDPSTTLIVSDASGRWQQINRDPQQRRVEYKTSKGSFDVLRGEGFRHTVPPDRDQLGNPDVVERLRSANVRIATAAGKRRVFVDPKCDRTIGGIHEWKAKDGRPNRRQNAAHGGDALTYLIWRFFPRRSIGDGKVEVEIVTPPKPRRRLRGF